MVMQPVGPLPASTYWRRRLVLLVALGVVLLLLRSLLGGGGGGTPTGARPTASPSSSVSPSRSPSPRPTGQAAPGTCPDSALSLRVAADAGTHHAGAPVRFTVTVKNVSRTACRRDLGGRVLELVIRSGDDRIWSSDDCSTDHTGSLQLLRAGASLETTVSWPGTRSARGCPTPRPDSRPGTYTVRARLATLRSPADVLRLTA
ncbi:MAG TPA: hypothetical protein VMZ11_06565 [Mycobacteriales bacterium]|nr:hypothetical protein [Mycobacteriales bacterium]